MFKSACDVVKKSVILSALLLVAGALLEVGSMFLSLESTLPVYFAYAGILAMFIAVLVLFITLIAVLIPKVNQHLQSCQH